MVADRLHLRHPMNPDYLRFRYSYRTMPKMTGDRLFEKIKEIRPDIPVIICTGHSPLINEKKAEKLGLDGLLMKSFVGQEIACLIRKVLNKQSAS